MKLYIGLRENAKPTIFESEKEPSKETNRLFDVNFGLFKNWEDAENYVNAMDCRVACSEG